MIYKVSEIFYSIMSEGFWTGTPMIFIRLFGCNLDCAWCDTPYAKGAGIHIAETVRELKFVKRTLYPQKGGYKELTESSILEKVKSLSENCNRVCITGGEPLIQDIKPLIEELWKERTGSRYQIHIETNGTQFFPSSKIPLWITVSPKTSRDKIHVYEISELKLPFDGTQNLKDWDSICNNKFLQPILQIPYTEEEMFGKETKANIDRYAENQKNISLAIRAVKQNPTWRLSCQIHKLLNFQ